MKTELLHKLRIKASKRLIIDEKSPYSDIVIFTIYYRGKKLFDKICSYDDYHKAKGFIFKKCDRIIRESILKDLKKYK